MNTLFDEKRLRKLIANLQILTGVPANILNTDGRDIYLFGGHPPFCGAINADPDGHQRCIDCDMWKVNTYKGDGGFQFYRCHLGICEALMPLYDKDQPLAWLVLGCFLDDSPIEEQWDRTRALLNWWPDGPDALRGAFFQFRQCSPQERRAYTETLEALAAYIRLEGMILAAEQSDLQRLEHYLDQHYMEKLSLTGLSQQLYIGRTRLCALAKELSGGHTLSYLIAQRRIAAAKRLLLQSNLPISAVAEQVGISDYNYFTKVFRSVTGMTPSRFRKSARPGPGHPAAPDGAGGGGLK